MFSTISKESNNSGSTMARNFLSSPSSSGLGTLTVQFESSSLMYFRGPSLQAVSFMPTLPAQTLTPWSHAGLIIWLIDTTNVATAVPLGILSGGNYDALAWSAQTNADRWTPKGSQYETSARGIEDFDRADSMEFVILASNVLSDGSIYLGSLHCAMLRLMQSRGTVLQWRNPTDPVKQIRYCTMVENSLKIAPMSVVSFKVSFSLHEVRTPAIPLTA